MVSLFRFSPLSRPIGDRQAVWNRRVNVVQPPEAKDTRGKATTKTNPTKANPRANAANAANASRLSSRRMTSTLPFRMVADPRNNQAKAETVATLPTFVNTYAAVGC